MSVKDIHLSEYNVRITIYTQHGVLYDWRVSILLVGWLGVKQPLSLAKR